MARNQRPHRRPPLETTGIPDLLDLTWGDVERGAIEGVGPEGQGRFAELMDTARTQFRKQFDREPGPDDPVFPELQKQGLPGTMSQMIEQLREVGAAPKFIYAFSKTGLMVTGSNLNSLSRRQRRDWQRACDEFDARDAEGDPKGPDWERMARAHTLARRLVRYCFRDLLEPFHGDMGHKISEPEMRELMIAVVNNVYTFLSIPAEVLADLPEPDWNEPKADPDLVAWLLRLASLNNPLGDK